MPEDRILVPPGVLQGDAGGGDEDEEELKFTVSLQRSGGLTLGIDVIYTSGLPWGGPGVFISKVFDEGLVNDWNKTSSEPRRVRKGDFIYRVNDVQDNTVAMIQELKANQNLTIEVMRRRSSELSPVAATGCRSTRQGCSGGMPGGQAGAAGMQPPPAPPLPILDTLPFEGPKQAPPAAGIPHPPALSSMPKMMPCQGPKKCSGQQGGIAATHPAVGLPQQPQAPPLPTSMACQGPKKFQGQNAGKSMGHFVGPSGMPQPPPLPMPTTMPRLSSITPPPPPPLPTALAACVPPAGQLEQAVRSAQENHSVRGALATAPVIGEERGSAAAAEAAGLEAPGRASPSRSPPSMPPPPPPAFLGCRAAVPEAVAPSDTAAPADGARADELAPADAGAAAAGSAAARAPEEGAMEIEGDHIRDAATGAAKGDRGTKECKLEASVEALLPLLNELGNEALGGLVCVALERRPWLRAAVLGDVGEEGTGLA